MRYSLIPVVCLWLLVSNGPLLAVKKDTQLILDELVKLTEQMNRMEEKVTILTSEWSIFGKRLEALESRIVAMVNNQADSNEKRENLVMALQFVREELNGIKNSIGSLQDQLLSAAPASPAAVEGGEASLDSEVKPAPESVESIYYTSYSDYIKQDYELAISGFNQFIEKYPSSPMADNALYWIGECHYAQRQYEMAVDVFSQLITRYGEGDKVADATLKKGFALIEMGRQNEGISVLKELISKFPLSEEASLAQQKLNDIKG